MKVSLIVLTKLKGRIAQALESALRQDYPDVEVLLVARDPGLDADAVIKGRDVRFLPTDRPLGRAEAANRGVEASAGEWVGFVDDEILLDVRHVRALVGGGAAARGHLVCFSYSKEPDEKNVPFNNPGFWRQRLLSGPPARLGGMLFDRALFDSHACRFDTAFDVFDDWDFMIQCAEYSDFLHIAGSTSRFEPMKRAPTEKQMLAARQRLAEKWGARYDEIVRLAESAALQADDAIRRKAPDEVFEPVQAALQLDAGNPRLLNQLAWGLTRRNDLPGALRAIRRACDSDPMSMHLLGDRVLLEHRLGNTEQARKSFVQLVEHSGSDAEWQRMKTIGALIGAEIDET